MDLFINGWKVKRTLQVLRDGNYLFDANGHATHRRCTNCGEWKRLEDQWTGNSTRRFGLQTFCRECNNKISLRYHRIRRAKIRSEREAARKEATGA